jgi:hypothetical protein
MEMTVSSRRSLGGIFLCLVLAISPSFGAWAESINIDNYSSESESPVTSIWTDEDVTGGVASPYAAGVEVVFPASGSRVARTNYGQLSQVLDASIQPGNLYSLSTPLGPFARSSLATYHVQLFEFTKLVLLAEATGTSDISLFKTLSRLYGVNNPASYGDILEIFLRSAEVYAEVDHP